MLTGRKEKGRPLSVALKMLEAPAKQVKNNPLIRTCQFQCAENSTENVGLEPMGLSPAFDAWQAPPVPPLEAFSETRLLPLLV